MSIENSERVYTDPKVSSLMDSIRKGIAQERNEIMEAAEDWSDDARDFFNLPPRSQQVLDKAA